MTNKYRNFIVPAIFYILLTVGISYALEPNQDNNYEQSGIVSQKTQSYFGIEYLFPTEKSRDIKTFNAYAYFLIKNIDVLNTSILAGVHATYAFGDMTQLEGELEEGTLREVNYKNTAFGIGPGFLVDVRLFHTGNFSFQLNGSGSFIWYNKDFPSGGDRYNFFWRAGPGIQYALNSNHIICFFYQWVHISNGQGLGSQNPSYEPQGLTLYISNLF